MIETRKRLKEIIDTKTKQIHARDNLIDELEQEIKQNNEEKKELRNENEELKLFRDDVIRIIKSKDTIVNKYDKINELVDNLEANN